MWIITFRAFRLSVAKKEFVCRLAGRMRTGEATPARWLDSVLGETWQTFLSDRGLTLPGFGGFYLEPKREVDLRVRSRSEAACPLRGVLVLL